MPPSRPQGRGDSAVREVDHSLAQSSTVVGGPPLQARRKERRKSLSDAAARRRRAVLSLVSAERSRVPRRPISGRISRSRGVDKRGRMMRAYTPDSRARNRPRRGGWCRTPVLWSTTPNPSVPELSVARMSDSCQKTRCEGHQKADALRAERLTGSARRVARSWMAAGVPPRRLSVFPMAL